MWYGMVPLGGMVPYHHPVNVVWWYGTTTIPPYHTDDGMNAGWVILPPTQLRADPGLELVFIGDCVLASGCAVWRRRRGWYLCSIFDFGVLSKASPSSLLSEAS